VKNWPLEKKEGWIATFWGSDEALSCRRKGVSRKPFGDERKGRPSLLSVGETNKKKRRLLLRGEKANVVVGKKCDPLEDLKKGRFLPLSLGGEGKRNFRPACDRERK